MRQLGEHHAASVSAGVEGANLGVRPHGQTDAMHLPGGAHAASVSAGGAR